MRLFPHSVASSLAAIVCLISATNAWAYCGCDKPPPPRAAVRPFAAYVDQTIQLFDERLVPGEKYTVRFTARDGSTDWSRGRVVIKRDFADGEMRPQLRVGVPAVGLGPNEISVFDRDDLFVYSL